MLEILIYILLYLIHFSVCLRMVKKRKTRPKFEESDLGHNSFADKDKLVIKISRGYDSFTDKATGKTHYKDREFEDDKYCRLYNKPENRLKVSSLSSPAKELLMWIAYELDSGKGYIWLNRERYMEESGIKSPTTVSLAVTELRRENFISTSGVREIYFINPNYFFFGIRANAFPDNVVKITK